MKQGLHAGRMARPASSHQCSTSIRTLPSKVCASIEKDL
eukprot:CAMPEP_0119358804 /NCGR_PEP_ID=MMETSP1334-20130426/6890_1 /TAXON_ID=127549 /ORGANISM="Calcidiscus leptoporus, Strain RCC1130" /LENGTH=38 /DNA_ID= /DNA_START= /DNA_END= /DNA_ORIENTATION=